MNLNDPFGFIRQQCLLHDIPLAGLCRRAGISRENLYRWETHIPSSIVILSRIEDVFKHLRGHENDCALIRLEALWDSLKEDPVKQAELLLRLEQLISEYHKGFH